MTVKKLIEVALPLEKINAAATYEKMPGIGPHPRGIHLWWARRPLAAARAVIWSSLVDDPSSHPEQFPTEEEQAAERRRLFDILEKLVVWKNSNDKDILAAAREEIMKSTGGDPPALLDPFAGGGAIPLEAQRLGLEAHASDLNPVAVMINKAMIEIPPRFANRAPVNPNAKERIETWDGARGLADDVRYYGEWMKREAFKRIGHLYPKVKVPKEQGGGEATVIAWIWARTVKCPNPACGCEMPLASSFVLSKKKGNEAWVHPICEYNDKTITYKVKIGKNEDNITPKLARGAKFKCIMCGEATTDEYIKQSAFNEKMGQSLLCVVAEGKNGRIYLSPDSIQQTAACVSKPDNYPNAPLPHDPRNMWCVGYGLNTFDKLFTNRQLTALTTFSALVAEAQKKATKDAVAAGMSNNNVKLADGGSGATAYGEAIGVYLTCAVDRLADFSTSVSRWSVSNEKAMNLFNKQAIPMTWDFPETNVLGDSVGGFSSIIHYIVDCVLRLPVSNICGIAKQYDAQSDIGLRNIMVSTDPPYYDNIGYADLSDFFYIWMRQSLKETYPKLFRTMLVPKAEELVATPYRFGGSAEAAKDFFESGMLKSCEQIYKYSRDDVPVTIYYAYKQSETDKVDAASTGWETMLSAIIQAGFAITGTWPLRTEQEYRSVGMGTNALASSIVLVCRKRQAGTPSMTRRSVINELKRELRPALQKLRQSNIAPVDMAQAAIGPGMGVYSRYSQVLEADGSPMSVRSALQIINQELDVFFNEQDGELDSDSRFCVDLYTQFAFNNIDFGDADTLARAKNTSVAALESRGALYAQKGVVRLLDRNEVPQKIDENEDFIWLLTQQLTRTVLAGGVQACASVVERMFGSNASRAKDLAYRLYTIAERRHWTQEAFAYNSLVIAWPEIQAAAAQITQATEKAAKDGQSNLFGKEE